MKVEKVQNYKILIVEDDRGLAQGIAMALKEENTLFLQAYSLEEARKLWKTPLANILLYAEPLEEKTSDPEEQVLAQILGRFYRGRQVQQEDGIGIGLYLAREILQKENGYIKVESKQGEGSTFGISLSKL